MLPGVTCRLLINFVSNYLQTVELVSRIIGSYSANGMGRYGLISREASFAMRRCLPRDYHDAHR